LASFNGTPLRNPFSSLKLASVVRSLAATQSNR
jgi:hypothetical protein